MSSTTCETCGGGGWVCAKCGKGRRPHRGRWDNDTYAHHGCGPRRRGAVIKCPTHKPRTFGCDLCGTVVTVESKPSNWTNGSRGLTCDKCQGQIEVATDTVGGTDFSRVGAIAVKNLAAAIRRLDPSALTPIQGEEMMGAIDDFAQRHNEYAARRQREAAEAEAKEEALR